MKKLIDDVKKDFCERKSYILFLIPLIIVAILFLLIILIGISNFDNYILGKISKIVNYNLTVVMGIITSMCQVYTYYLKTKEFQLEFYFV